MITVGWTPGLDQPYRNGSVSDTVPASPMMAFTTRTVVAKELNAAWAEFTEMWTGPLIGREVAEAFWKYVTR